MKFYSIFLILIFSANIHASSKIRKCLLLPIQDSVQGAIGFKVFENVERYLKESDWCYYKYNSEIIDILKNYKENLPMHLSNPDVLKVISEKTDCGSLIKVELQHQPKGLDVILSVFGENGADLYYREKAMLNSDDVVVISQTVTSWLEKYNKIIPYSGVVVGVLGDQFTINVGKYGGMTPASTLEVVRPIRKRKHPLLKEVVDWEVESIATASTYHVAENQSHAKVISYFSEKKIQIDDWVVKKKEKIEDQKAIENYQESHEEYSFGKLGVVGIYGSVGKFSETVNVSSSSQKKIGGTAFGALIRTELWATRNYWMGLELGKKFSSLSPESGSFSNSSFSLNQSNFKLKLGYKYLPMGFFYGPQIDFYTGYASTTYGLDNQAADGIVETKLKGMLFGSRGSVPIKKLLRAHIDLGFVLSPSYSEEATVFGSDESTSAWNFEMGGSYSYTPTMNFEAFFSYHNGKASFSGGRKVSFKDSALNAGMSFNY
jgi:hypothetical protein